jgi:hypothetical protein
VTAFAAWYLNLLDEYGLTTILAVQAAALIALGCVAGVVLDTVAEYRLRRAEERAMADLGAEDAAWEALDIERGLAAALEYANNPAVRAAWAHLPAPKGGGIA